MSQRRNKKIAANVEELIYTALQRAINQNGIRIETESNYVRALIVRDLKARGLLTDEMLESLVC